MKRYVILIMTLAMIFMASSAFANFPGPNGRGFPNPLGDGTVEIQLLHGWVAGTDAWYHAFTTNNIKEAMAENLTLTSPFRTPAFGSMFVVTNFDNHGPVFPLPPPNNECFLEAVYLTWNPGVTPWIITSQLVAGPPHGLPDFSTQATLSPHPPWDPSGFVLLDPTVFAIGPLSNPWRQSSTASPPFYRIPQGISVDTYTKKLRIPYWNIYCQDSLTKRISVKKAVIPDANPTLAPLIGANSDFGLSLQEFDEFANLFNVINWAQDCNALAPGIQPLGVFTDQYPVLCDCPTISSWRNTNLNYSSLAQFALLNRNYSNPAILNNLYTNCPFIQAQVTAGNLISVQYPTPPLPTPPIIVPYPPDNGFLIHAPVICDN